MTQTSDLKAIADAIRERERFLVVTHENPDGDALGSLLAATLALRSLGKDAVMYLAGEAPLPREYAFMPLEGLVREAPADAAERVLLAVDCAKEERIGDSDAVSRAPFVLDVDHHHDNTRFGDVNLIVPDASSTGEVLRDVIAELGLDLTPELAEPLYIALVTDTGRFQYANTTPKALRLAAELVEAGANIHAVFQQVYESVDFAKLKLLARVLDRAEVLEGGRIVVSHLLRSDFAEVGASEPYSEGLIDYLRAVEGAELAVFVREQLSSGAEAHKGSLRSSIDELDVSAIARTFGGGGHRQAAGFSTDLPLAEIVAQIREGFLAQRATTRA
jgi:phosphoesterase RecJ-like protein